jgi:membrane-bound inhibitor of C-type lysozyme
MRLVVLELRAGATAATLVSLIGCSQPAATESKWLSFACPDGQIVAARFEPKDDAANVRFADHEYRLPHVISGSGARYSDGVTTFWNKGRSAMILVKDQVVAQDCMQQ